jgi:hypothetical protein
VLRIGRNLKSVIKKSEIILGLLAENHCSTFVRCPSSTCLPTGRSFVRASQKDFRLSSAALGLFVFQFGDAED